MCSIRLCLVRCRGMEAENEERQQKVCYRAGDKTMLLGVKEGVMIYN